MILPNPTKLSITRGVLALKGHGFNSPADDYLFEIALRNAVIDTYNDLPDETSDGGNDKYFFTLKWRGTKFFVAANEVNGLTVMLPDEY